ncbi:MAG: tRNA preQ1(34) S-adenosylmethionine ribosyltransferase-isomerase QueA [Acidobacteria bacterium]|nr:tRNA preQ1(34) S-adenosylmethionine ribosyltransferase-isomerase QueA [Acidobacteriota bacterium]MBI3657522.1 tRNA preQ1(34) S-adenosylmethionine ribosyltransferase-isomerase QueA [Acidobacteriota bacterium]
MNTSDFAYQLPSELIAQEPAGERANARLMLAQRSSHRLEHHAFHDLPQLLRRGDLLVLNNTKVFPARLIGRPKGKSGTVEVFLIRQADAHLWEVLVRPGRKLHSGAHILFGEGLVGHVDKEGPHGRRWIRFEYAGDFFTILDRMGQTPLPPYIHRERGPSSSDSKRYQTVYARALGSVAAPTAGLHFTHEILESMRQSGMTVCEITLHIGYGTFQPIRTECIENHRMEPEHYSIPPETADLINAQKARGGRVIAVGTTTTRTLEAVARAHDGKIAAGAGVTDLFIYPGFSFQIISGLITNFHLPRSSLLMLVCAFAGKDWTLEWYQEAIRQGYRFYSYGDATLIL